MRQHNCTMTKGENNGFKTMKPAFHAKTKQKGRTSLEELFSEVGKSLICFQSEDYHELS